MSENNTEQPPPAAPPAEQAPPWGSEQEFNPEKAWKLIQDLRADKEKLSARPVLDDTAKQRLEEYDRLVEASKTDLERKTEEVARWQTEAERWRAASVKSQIQALAAVEFADPTDAVNALDPAKYLDAGGDVNTEAIKTDLAALLDAKPHYRRPEGARLPAPNLNQGSGANGKTAGDPAQEFAAILGAQLH